MACNLVTFLNRENHEEVSFVIFAQDPKGRDYFGITLGLLWDYLAFRCCCFLKYFCGDKCEFFRF